MLYYVIATPLLLLFDWLVFGIRVRGRRHIRQVKGQGAVLVCNHVHPFDCTFLGLLFWPRRAVFTSLERLFSVPVVGPLIHWMGSVPVPFAPSKMRFFLDEMVRAVQGGRLLCIYPEGELLLRCGHLREFREGAFTIAARAEAPVIPVMVTSRPPAGLWRLFKRRPCMTITAGEPIYPDVSLPARQRARQLHVQALYQMKNMQ